MFSCFICNSILLTVDELIHHIKLIHFIKKGDKLTCHQFNCFSTFYDLNTYKRHLKNTHANNSANTINSTNNITSVIQSRSNNIPTVTLPILTNTNNLENINKDFEIDIIENNTINQDEVTEFSKKLSQSALTFVCNLFSESHLTTKIIEKILADITELLSSFIFTKLNDIILPKINNQNKTSVKKLFNNFENVFNGFNTEYLLLKTLKEQNLYSPPLKFEIDNTVTSTYKKGKSVLSKKISEGILLPIEFQITKFFEQPGVLEKTLDYTKTLMESGEKFENFVQGALWKEKMNHFNNNQNVVPLIMYYDDFETGNSLGSHCGKQSIAAFYYHFPTLPSNCTSLVNIFVAMLVKTSHIKIFSTSRTLCKLVEVLSKLENGIVITVLNKPIIVHFLVGLFIGDNLALNNILGFSGSFNHNFCCRICKIPKSDIGSTVLENENLFRNIDNYDDDIKKNDYKNTGIKESSPLNSLSFFHVTKNIYGDLMHDCLEGCIKFGLMSSLSYFIYEKKYISLETLNKKIESFEYGEIEIHNRPMTIKSEHLKHNVLHATSRETYCFLRYITLLIGEFIPETETVWKYILKLKEMVDFILKDSFTNIEIICLKELIKDHHKLYIQCFKMNLKPKHHFICHYPTVIKNSGPLKPICCMRQESKNKQVKEYSKVSFSRVNLELSLAKKCSLQFSSHILENYSSKPYFKMIKKRNIQIFEMDNFSENIIFPFNTSENVVTCIALNYKGTMFKINYFIELYSKLYTILNFIKVKEDLFLILNEYDVSNFDVHFRAYIVGAKKENIICINFEMLQYKKPFQTHRLFDGRSCYFPRVF